MQHIDRTIYYTGSLAAKGNIYTVSLEEVSHDPFPSYTERYKLLSASEGRIRILKRKADDIESNDYAYRDQELIVAQLRDPARYPLLDEIRRLLSDWVVFRGFGENALNNLYMAQPLEVVQPLRLDPLARNLVSVLHALDYNAEYDDAKSELREVLELAFPDFDQLDLTTVAAGMVELRWRSKEFRGLRAFPARSMSDGMLRFIGLATLLLLPDPPALIVIDEPEVGLHPELISLLGGLLKQASERTQVIVTTHSPLLLSSEGIEPSDVVIVERQDGATRLERADSRTYLDRWLERYTLGQLWTMGKLEG